MPAAKPHQRFKEARQQLGLNQVDFAEKAHIKQSQVSQIETGTREISGTIYAALEHFLNINPSWIESGGGHPFTGPVEKAMAKQRVYDQKVQNQRLRSGLKNSNMNAQAERLRLFREHENISTDQLASELNVSVSTLNKYENGKLYLPVEVAVYLHDKYRMNYEWFFNGTGQRKKTGSALASSLTIDDLYETQNTLAAKIDNLQKELKIERGHRKQLQRNINTKTPTQLRHKT